MSGTADDLLARLANLREQPGDDDPWSAVAATDPDHEADDEDPKLANLLARINNLTSSAMPGDIASVMPAPACHEPGTGSSEGGPRPEFYPVEPKTYQQAGINDAEVESLALKFMLARGAASGHEIAEQLRLPFILIEDLLRDLKSEQLVFYRSTTTLNDYVYQLTDLGRERARRHAQHCTYYGSAPVSLYDYIDSVKAQSLQDQHPTKADLDQAFQDLLINVQMFNRLGPAINSGRGMFLYGYPGNGKTSIAERVTRAFGRHIWIPRALSVDGEIMRLFDPMNHEEEPLEKSSGLLDHRKVDSRWVRIRRPTIIVGGELTMQNLEVSINPNTGISEAPLQLKSNCGTLVIDDFGRQKMSTDELLNRWIVPLEKRYDFLNMANGKKIQVPFDQLVVFSTNLEPKDLVDDAFLRRIPYKIEVKDPTEQEFRELFRIMCPKMGFDYDGDSIEYLIDHHYKRIKRPFRCCQPRDLLLQVRNNCLYQNAPLELSREQFDFAVENYFSIM